MKKKFLQLGTLFFCILLLAAAGDKEKYGLLPAHNWNLANLEKIHKIAFPKSGNLTFAVFGDNHNNRETFEQLLRKVNQDPNITFAIDLGDMVERGELEDYDIFFKQVRENLQIPLLGGIGNHELIVFGWEPNNYCVFRQVRRSMRALWFRVIGNHKLAEDLELYRVIFGPDGYTFRINDHYFLFLDDAKDNGVDQQQLQWLRDYHDGSGMPCQD